ncbi:hypothetical protein Syun_028937 [Stephania yunnanensis]|uniref:C3H1-type domain-containing protein n=1 Tax=Stephania yunnanensis TaxID=152371 RepID=A0AAP0ECD1_9MAGN
MVDPSPSPSSSRSRSPVGPACAALASLAVRLHRLTRTVGGWPVALSLQLSLASRHRAASPLSFVEGGAVAVGGEMAAAAAAAARGDRHGETGLEAVLAVGVGRGRGREGGGGFVSGAAGEANCIYYMKTGTCGYGDRCRYNHPRDRGSALGAALQGGEYPEREGQPVCQYFLKTGTCKFGSSCKYHHPKDGGGSANSVQLNYNGYPLRPDEKECSYYMKTGLCKFGITCKFHHPQPTGASLPAPAPAPAFYQMVQSPLVQSTTQYGGVAANWPGSRPPILPASYVQGPYGPVMLPPEMVPLSGWNTFQAPVSPVASSTSQLNAAAGPFYGISQLSPSAPAYGVTYQPVSSPVGPSSGSQKETTFPERPGQPECLHYMRTGIGLPLRPGAPACLYYTQHGVCKFGPLCKFDHSMGLLRYTPSASSLTEVPVAPYPVGSSLTTLTPSFSSPELRQEFIVASNKDTYLNRMQASHSTSSGSTPQSVLQSSGWTSSPSSGNGTGHGSENRSSS